ncbi:hypothetical protein BMF94_2819 [Rhodotorula taiwanensis]|uniref:O-acyltransferase WSD1-like N-terminal domain-containing protein n=1 Tax=Rhodotorula taiwanensis TaxID=741276 RepID=A0A2S5BB79_9BASI|nr:hypothetical protein BMF94_2819 [Rhodotorula taiwanensis]
MHEALRSLSLLERYSLARVNVGAPPVVVFTAVLRRTSPDSALKPAVNTLLERYPLLRCRIADHDSSDPRWEPLASLEPEAFVGTADEITASGTGTDARAVILAGFETMSRIDVSQQPLWRVWLFPGPDSGSSRVVLAVHHVVADGTGVRNLFSDFLSLLRAPYGTATDNKNDGALAPAMESLLPIQPSFIDTAKLAWSELVLPNLPTFLRPATTLIHLGKPPVHPLKQPSAIRISTLEASLLAQLKAVAKEHGVATLHTVLYVSTLAAIQKHKTGVDTVAIGSSPASIRGTEAAIPHATGNYVYDIEQEHPADLAAAPFWTECAAYARRLVDPETKRSGLKRTGHLALIPTGTLSPSGEPGAPRNRFDAWMKGRLTKSDPCEATFEVSNLGLLPPTGWEKDGLLELAWAQTSMVTTALAFNPIATRGGDLVTTVTYRAGFVEESLVDEIVQSYESILSRIANGQVPADATFSQL